MTAQGTTKANVYFSERFEVAQSALDEYGAFDISVVSDLPLFVDPFLLFNSHKKDYQGLHESIINYLLFLRDRARDGQDVGLLASWYQFHEVKQNWLGYTHFGNNGRALGRDFAMALNASLGDIFRDFGQEKITKGTHLEKLCLIQGGVGKDNISDFTTNLIKGYLAKFTERFALKHLNPKHCRTFRIPKVQFNYSTESWEEGEFYLPVLGNDFVLLTPVDMLTRDETWISQADMLHQFWALPEAMPNDQLRAQINNYFRSRLGEKPTEKEIRAAQQETITKFPELIDRYIAIKEDDGDRAESVSSRRVQETRRVLVDQVQLLLADLEQRTDFYKRPWSSYEEALERVRLFKSYIENQDGYKLINKAGQPFSHEDDVQLFFGLAWFGSELDINREVNNGRGPVDFKASFGSGDKSLIEFKLASNRRLKTNLAKQVEIYERANRTHKSIKVIVCYSAADQERVAKILDDLGLATEPNIVVIDARSDNKPSASKA